MNTYRILFMLVCPVDGEPIDYCLQIESRKMVRAEAIVAAVNALPSPAFHEDIANTLIGELGGRQTIRAKHGSVEITTVRGVV